MSVDWFTIAAQALNFLVLVWLLKRFLYKPVLNAIDARGAAIAQTLSAAKTQQIAAEQVRQDFVNKSGAFEAERAALLAKAVSDANAERERLLAQARAAADALRVTRDQSARAERAQWGQEIYALVQQEVLAIARRTLGDLADSTLEERIQEVFARRLRGLDDAGRQALRAAISGAPEVIVSSTFDLPPVRRAALRAALDESLSTPVTLRFMTSANLGCGIELLAGGQKIAWSIADYLSALEGKVATLAGAPAPVVTVADASRTPHAGLERG